LKEKKIKEFYNIVEGISFEKEVRDLMKEKGIGKMKKNVIMMG
jgi:hypothetical protein